MVCAGVMRDTPRPAQDNLQPVRPLEQAWRVQQDIGRTGSYGRHARSGDDRCDASEGVPHSREPFKKGPVPRRIRRTKGGLNFKLYVGEHLEVRIRRCGAKKGS